MKHFSAACLSALIAITAQNAQAQGCSDPGFTTMGAMRSNSAIVIQDDVFEYNVPSIGIGMHVAQGEEDVTILSPQIETRIPIGEWGYVEAKLPFNFLRGELGNAKGIGDASITYTQVYADAESFTYQLTGGFKVGMTHAAELDEKHRSLPMAYQPGLGTTDVVVGASAQFRKYVALAIGYQQPIVHYNNNDYNGLNTRNDLEYSSDYAVSRKLYRRGDVMMRLEGGYNGDRAGFMVGPLAVYHLGNDLYEDLNGKWREIDGSNGITLNVTANVFVRFGRYGQWKIDATGGLPLVQRDTRPDGLTRDYIFSPRLTYFFDLDELIW